MITGNPDQRSLDSRADQSTDGEDDQRSPAIQLEIPRARRRDTAAHVRDRLADFGRTIVVVIALIAIWEASIRLFDVDPLLFPSFTAVFDSFLEGFGFGVDGAGTYWSLTWATLLVLVKSYVIAVFLAIILTSAAAGSRWGRAFLKTTTGIFQPLPGVALVPLAILWFGLNETALIFVVVMTMLWPLTAALSVGFATIPETLIRVGQNYELGRLAMVRRIMLPMALPSAIAGARVSWGYGWRTVVGAEIVFGATGAQRGLGWSINNARLLLRVDDALSSILVVIIIGLITEGGFSLIQRKTTHRWGMERA